MFNESAEEAWRLRFQTAQPSSPFEPAKLLTHRSVRRFEQREVPEETVQWLMACAQSAATSSNLQMWTAISVQDPDRRKAIAALCSDQRQIHEAAWFFGFFADHYRLRKVAEAIGETPAGLDYNEFFTMAIVDAALAAERMVCAAESIGLGICYIGALRNKPYDVADLLDLPKGLFGVFGLCLGWPDTTEQRADIKPRLLQDQIWHREKYDHQIDVSEYDERMSAFYADQGMKGEVTWSMRSGRRIDGDHMTGREILKRYLSDHDLDVR